MRPAVARLARFLTVALALGVALGGVGTACKTDGARSTAAPAAAGANAPLVDIDTGERKLPFRVEVALTSEEHQRGLMYRQHLDADAGMLFVFPEPRLQVFWMKNTFIPLDMIFIGADRRIVGVVENAVPETTVERKVDRSSQYVLEIGGGLSAKLGIRAGQPVEFHAIPSP